MVISGNLRTGAAVGSRREWRAIAIIRGIVHWIGELPDGSFGRDLIKPPRPNANARAVDVAGAGTLLCAVPGVSRRMSTD